MSKFHRTPVMNNLSYLGQIAKKKIASLFSILASETPQIPHY